MNRTSLSCFLSVIVLVGISGCVQETEEGSKHIFTYELWVPLSIMMAGILAVPVGWLIRKTAVRFGWGLLIMGPLAAIFFAPSIFRDRATVDDTSFSLRTGIWGMTSVHEVKFDDLKQVRIVSEKVTGRRGRQQTNFFLLCERRDGSNAKIPVNNKVSEAATPYFLKKITERGIPVVDAT